MAAGNSIITRGGPPSGEIEVKWAPKDQHEEKKAWDFYGEYTTKHKSVMELALINGCSSPQIRKMIKWCSLQLALTSGDLDLQKGYLDSTLINHINELKGLLIPEKAEKLNKETGEMETVELKINVKDKLAIMRELRMTYRDLAEVRGIKDMDGGGKINDNKIQIVLPELNRGEGTKVVASVNGENQELN